MVKSSIFLNKNHGQRQRLAVRQLGPLLLGGHLLHGPNHLGPFLHRGGFLDLGHRPGAPANEVLLFIGERGEVSVVEKDLVVFGMYSSEYKQNWLLTPQCALESELHCRLLIYRG